MSRRGSSRSHRYQEPRLELSRDRCLILNPDQPPQQSLPFNRFDAFSKMIEDMRGEDELIRDELQEKRAQCLEFGNLLEQANREVTNLKHVIDKNCQAMEAEKIKFENAIDRKNEEFQAMQSELSRANLEEREKMTAQLISVQQTLDEEIVSKEKLQKQVLKLGIDIGVIRKDLKEERKLRKKKEEKILELDKIIEEQESRIYHFDCMMTEDYEKKRKLLGDMWEPLKKMKGDNSTNQ